jgi:hypothetical protein
MAAIFEVTHECGQPRIGVRIFTFTEFGQKIQVENG